LLEKKDWPIKLIRQVDWGQMDVFHHVNHKAYFAWMEAGRIEHMKQLGLQSHAKGISIILAETNCKYLFPVDYPDSVLIKVRTQNLGSTSWNTEYEIDSQKHSRVIAKGTARCVFYDYDKLVKAEIPPDMRSAILALEQPPKT